MTNRRHLQEPCKSCEISVADLRSVVGLPVRIVTLAARHLASRVLRILFPVFVWVDARKRLVIATISRQPAGDAPLEALGEDRFLPDVFLLDPVQYEIRIAGDRFLEGPPDSQRNVFVRDILRPADEFAEDRECSVRLETPGQTRELAPHFGIR